MGVGRGRQVFEMLTTRFEFVRGVMSGLGLGLGPVRMLVAVQVLVSGSLSASVQVTVTVSVDSDSAVASDSRGGSRLALCF